MRCYSNPQLEPCVHSKFVQRTQLLIESQLCLFSGGKFRSETVSKQETTLKHGRICMSPPIGISRCIKRHLPTRDGEKPDRFNDGQIHKKQKVCNADASEWTSADGSLKCHECANT